MQEEAKTGDLSTDDAADMVTALFNTKKVTKYDKTTVTTATPAVEKKKENDPICKPCLMTDDGCTHPGIATQAWCNSRCTEGVNDPLLCPKSHCICKPATKEEAISFDAFAL